MTFKARLLLALVHFIARIQGVVLWLRRRIKGAPPPVPEPERTLILMVEGPIIHFMAVAFHADKIIEQYGVAGQPAPRAQHPPGIRGNIQDRIDELLEDGYTPLEDFPTRGGLIVTCQLPTQLGADGFFKWRAAFGDFLAERGLGVMVEPILEGNDIRIEILSCLPDFAKPLIENHLSGGELGQAKLEQVDV